MKNFAGLVLISLFSLTLAACATGGSNAGEMEIRSGKIEQINPAQIASNHHTGVGAILGGLGGAALGSLIGNGTGRDVAMVAGALGGALGGNELQKKYDQPRPGQQVIVRLNNGVLVSIVQPINQSLRPGMKVFIEGAGTQARVIAQQ